MCRIKYSTDGEHRCLVEEMRGFFPFDRFRVRMTAYRVCVTCERL